jgi:hypothetical protein
MDGRLQGSFLWVDEEPDRLRRVRAGEILVSPVGRQVPKPVPNGLIHDWMGAAFIPNTSLERVLSIVRNYGDYKQFYQGCFEKSKQPTTKFRLSARSRAFASAGLSYLVFFGQ